MKWCNVWSYTQQDYRSWPSTIENDRQVVRIRSNHQANGLKLRFSNEYGSETILFEKVKLSVLEKETNHVKETAVVTIASSEKIAVLPGANLLSDQIPIAVCVGDSLVVETTLRRKTVLVSGIVSYSKREVEVSNYSLEETQKEPKKQKELFRMVSYNERMFFIYGMSGIDFLVEDTARTIAFFGDSLIQQGFIVDHYKKELFDRALHNTAVLNRGIGGSRVLKGQDKKQDPFTRHGKSGLFRFEKEIFYTENIDDIICFHGINDLISRNDQTGEYTHSLEELKQGLLQYASFAHQHGKRVFIGTITPMKKSIFYNEDFEKERQELNAWIRKQEAFDGVLDFEQAVVDKTDLTRLFAPFDSGDGLHLSDAGGAAIARSIIKNMPKGKGE